MRTATCPRCHTAVIHILDDHGIDVTLDAQPLSIVGEALAVINGRRTWNIRRSRRHAADIWWRRPHHIGRDHGGTLHTTHRCDQPIPNAWTTPPTPARATTEECPF